MDTFSQGRDPLRRLIMKEFDLYRTLSLLTALAVIFALLFQLDYSGVSVMWQDFLTWTATPFEWKQGHYLVLLVAIVVYGK